MDGEEIYLAFPIDDIELDRLQADFLIIISH